MTSLEPGLYVRIEELDNGPKPFPLDSGFSLGHAYRALGLYHPSETSDAYFVLSNDRDEIRFICNQHVRAYALLPDERAWSMSTILAARRQLSWPVEAGNDLNWLLC
jgi:hypothetical protein